MILSFSTKINNKPTYFPQKIWKGLEEMGYKTEDFKKSLTSLAQKELAIKSRIFDKLHIPILPKVTTIRVDEKNRWKPGMRIHYYINSRQKNMFQFAPVIPAKSVQRIFITYEGTDVTIVIDNNLFEIISIDDLQNGDVEKNERMLMLAQNDGFESAADFFTYFNKNFIGNIIHWTNLKY